MASDLGLHCLAMSLLWDARHKWVKLVLVGGGGGGGGVGSRANYIAVI